LYVSNVRVFRFRNLSDQSIALRRGPVFVTGNNGNGKTNLVEAIYLLSGARSFRTNTTTELAAWGNRECSVFGTVSTATGTFEIGIGFKAGSREGFLNGDKVESISELVGRVAIVAFSPADLALVKGAPAGRRKFLDRHTTDLEPSLLRTLMSYQRALANKSALLKEPGTSPRELEPWNELLIEHGCVIAAARHRFLESLADSSNGYHAQYGATDGQLTLKLESDFIENGEVNADRVREQFARIATREIGMRSTLFGIHRDDVAIELAGTDARAYASQGQTRSVVLSLKLAVIQLYELKLGESPIILLDDVDSELDAGRGSKLFSVLMEQNRQLLITGTGAPPYGLAEHPELQILRMERGAVTDSAK